MTLTRNAHLYRQKYVQTCLEGVGIEAKTFVTRGTPLHIYAQPRAAILIPNPWMMTGQWLEVGWERADMGAAMGGGELSLHLYAPGC